MFFTRTYNRLLRPALLPRYRRYGLASLLEGVLSASSPLIGFTIMSGTIKAAYTGTAIALLIAAERGSAALVANTRQATSQLTMRVREVRRDMLWVATKITKPVLKLGKAALTLPSRSKTGVGKPEQVRDTTPEHGHDQIAPG